MECSFGDFNAFADVQLSQGHVAELDETITLQRREFLHLLKVVMQLRTSTHWTLQHEHMGQQSSQAVQMMRSVNVHTVMLASVRNPFDSYAYVVNSTSSPVDGFEILRRASSLRPGGNAVDGRATSVVERATSLFGADDTVKRVVWRAKRCFSVVESNDDIVGIEL